MVRVRTGKAWCLWVGAWPFVGSGPSESLNAGDTQWRAEITESRGHTQNGKAWVPVLVLWSAALNGQTSLVMPLGDTH